MYQVSTEQIERQKQRIKAIYFFLKKQKAAVKIQELADEFGYGVRTMQRDLKILECNNYVQNLGKGFWVIK